MSAGVDIAFASCDAASLPAVAAAVTAQAAAVQALAWALAAAAAPSQLAAPAVCWCGCWCWPAVEGPPVSAARPASAGEDAEWQVAEQPRSVAAAAGIDGGFEARGAKEEAVVAASAPAGGASDVSAGSACASACEGLAAAGITGAASLATPWRVAGGHGRGQSRPGRGGQQSLQDGVLLRNRFSGLAGDEEVLQSIGMPCGVAPRGTESDAGSALEAIDEGCRLMDVETFGGDGIPSFPDIPSRSDDHLAVNRLFGVRGRRKRRSGVRVQGTASSDDGAVAQIAEVITECFPEGATVKGEVLKWCAKGLLGDASWRGGQSPGACPSPTGPLAVGADEAPGCDGAATVDALAKGTTQSLQEKAFAAASANDIAARNRFEPLACEDDVQPWHEAGGTFAVGGGARQEVDGRRGASAAGGRRSAVDWEQWGDADASPRAASDVRGGSGGGSLRRGSSAARGDPEVEFDGDGGDDAGGSQTDGAVEVAATKVTLRRQREAEREAAAAKRVRQRRRRRRSREKVIDEATARAEQCTNGESSTAMDAARIELQRVLTSGLEATAAEPGLTIEAREIRVLEVAKGFQDACHCLVPDSMPTLREEMLRWLVGQTRRVLGEAAGPG